MQPQQPEPPSQRCLRKKKSGDSGKTDGKDDGTQKPAAKPGSALSNTGASVFGVGITAVILLAAAGAAYAFRKRRA